MNQHAVGVIGGYCFSKLLHSPLSLRGSASF
jgi:hypothetical protein